MPLPDGAESTAEESCEELSSLATIMNKTG